jgi:hypothetical protein
MQNHAKAHYSGEPVKVFKNGDDQLSESAAKTYCAGEILEGILALLDTPSATQPSQVRVKPLVWYGKPEGQDQRIGRCGDIAYSVRYDMGAWGYTRQGESGLTISYKDGRTFTDEADAINGADVDHEARIMAALDLSGDRT